MEKSIYTREYKVLLRLLREARERAGVTQVELARRLGQTQSFVSKIEVGDRRLDLVQLRTVLAALDVRLGSFVRRFEEELARLP
ncbi:MAG: helix-turn-helix transcriptional regulator [Isosphaeraceae bacterium]